MQDIYILFLKWYNEVVIEKLPNFLENDTIQLEYKIKMFKFILDIIEQSEQEQKRGSPFTGLKIDLLNQLKCNNINVGNATLSCNDFYKTYVKQREINRAIQSRKKGGRRKRKTKKQKGGFGFAHLLIPMLFVAIQLAASEPIFNRNILRISGGGEVESEIVNMIITKNPHIKTLKDLSYNISTEMKQIQDMMKIQQEEEEEEREREKEASEREASKREASKREASKREALEKELDERENEVFSLEELIQIRQLNRDKLIELRDKFSDSKYSISVLASSFEYITSKIYGLFGSNYIVKIPKKEMRKLRRVVEEISSFENDRLSLQKITTNINTRLLMLETISGLPAHDKEMRKKFSNHIRDTMQEIRKQERKDRPLPLGIIDGMFKNIDDMIKSCYELADLNPNKDESADDRIDEFDKYIEEFTGNTYSKKKRTEEDLIRAREHDIYRQDRFNDYKEILKRLKPDHPLYNPTFDEKPTLFQSFKRSWFGK